MANNTGPGYDLNMNNPQSNGGFALPEAPGTNPLLGNLINYGPGSAMYANNWYAMILQQMAQQGNLEAQKALAKMNQGFSLEQMNLSSQLQKEMAALQHQYGLETMGVQNQYQRENREDSQAFAANQNANNTLSRLIGTGYLSYKGADKYGRQFQKMDYESLAAIERGGLPTVLSDQFDREARRRSENFNVARGGQRGTDASSMAGAYLSEHRERADAGDRARFAWQWGQTERQRLEDRKALEASGLTQAANFNGTGGSPTQTLPSSPNTASPSSSSGPYSLGRTPNGQAQPGTQLVNRPVVEKKKKPHQVA